jgi:hypothetical protein
VIKNEMTVRTEDIIMAQTQETRDERPTMRTLLLSFTVLIIRLGQLITSARRPTHCPDKNDLQYSRFKFRNLGDSPVKRRTYCNRSFPAATLLYQSSLAAEVNYSNKWDDKA